MKRVVLYGGSFDPIHNGHLALAKTCVKQRNADELWFIVSKRSPFKTKSTSFHHRFKMVELMIKGYKKLKVSKIENTLPDPSYTIDTILKLKKENPDIQFEFLIGPDQIADLEKWKNFAQIEKEVQVICYNMPQDTKYDLINIVGPEFEVRSTLIREGKSLDTRPSVIRYMTENSLYTKEWLENRLSKKRYEHVLRVEEVALEILNTPRMQMAVLFHDFTKEASPEEQIAWMEQTSYSLDHPSYMYHAFTAASLLAKRYYVRDREVIRAIRGHVNGDSTNTIGMVLYIADKCERGRGYDSESYIELAKKDLNAAFKACKENQKKYLKEKY